MNFTYFSADATRRKQCRRGSLLRDNAIMENDVSALLT